MRILYYAELDPSAGIGQTVDDFRAARSEVALSCLLHDVVVVQPDNLLEHSWTCRSSSTWPPLSAPDD